MIKGQGLVEEVLINLLLHLHHGELILPLDLSLVSKLPLPPYHSSSSTLGFGQSITLACIFAALGGAGDRGGSQRGDKFIDKTQGRC